MDPANTRRTRGFTLVELLVVITIIGVLVALLIPAIGMARRRAQLAAISAEMNTVSQGIEQFKNDIAGGAYPPNAYAGVESSTPLGEKTFNDFKRFFKKAFPRSREPENLLRAIAGVQLNSANPNDVNADFFSGGMSPTEAVVFWLQRFSSDPRYPLSGPGGPSFLVNGEGLEDLSARNWLSGDAVQRLGMLDGAGEKKTVAQIYTDYAIDMIPRHIRYGIDDNNNGTIDEEEERQINFWQYFPGSSTVPLVYFDASRGVRDIAFSSSGSLYSVKQLKAGAADPNAPTVGDVRLANEGKFQLLHCGVDGDWGDFENAFYVDPNDTPTAAYTGILFPDGPYPLEIRDTLTNFTDGSLEDAQP